MDSIPDEYAFLARLYDPATAWALDPLRRELAVMAAREGAESALDVCCGTGRQCWFFARAGIPAVGVDLSGAMLSRGKRYSKDVLLMQSDARALPVADAAFPFVSIAFALHEKPEAYRPAILSEMMRVAMPGGLVAVADYLTPRGAGEKLFAMLVKGIERLAGKEHHASYAQFMGKDGLEGLLRECGLKPEGMLRYFQGLVGVALLRKNGSARL